MSLFPGAADADLQLQAIDNLGRALEQHAIDHWLFGGWAVDFWVGSVTRPHEDIDVAAWRTDYDAIRVALQGAGWRHAPVPDEAVGTRYEWRGVQAEFTFVVDQGGSVVVPLPGHPVVWTTEPLGTELRQLNGVRCRTIPLALLREGKKTPREGEAESVKDISDWEQLSQLG